MLLSSAEECHLDLTTKMCTKYKVLIYTGKSDYVAKLATSAGSLIITCLDYILNIPGYIGFDTVMTSNMEQVIHNTGFQGCLATEKLSGNARTHPIPFNQQADSWPTDI